MKIALIIAWTFKQLDGSTLRLFFTLQELIKRNHEVTLIQGDRDAASYARSRFKCDVLHVNVLISRWDNILTKIINYFLFVIRARRLVKQFHFDAVYSMSLLNNLVGIAVPAPCRTILYVDFMSNYYRYRNPGIFGKPLFLLARFLENYTIRKADRVVVITKELKKLIDPAYHHKVHIIPDGADTQHFKPGLDTHTVKSKFGISPDAVVIGYQGGIEPHDGLQFLVEAAPYIVDKIPNVKFVIAGRGSYLVRIKKAISDKKIKKYWIFTGWVENNMIPGLIAASDVTAVPVPDDPCTAPLITFRLLESMASGAVIVANDLPGMREIADDSMVLFTRVEDPALFSAAVIQAVSLSREDKKIRSERCRKKIEALDWREIARQEVDLLGSYEKK